MTTKKLEKIRTALVSANQDLLKGEFDGEIQILSELIDQPAPTTDIADFIAGAFGVSRGTAYDMMLDALKEASLVQPVAWRTKNFYEGQQSWFYADWHSDGLVPQIAELLYAQAQPDVRLVSNLTKNLLEISTAVSNKNEDAAQKILGKTLRLLLLDATPPAAQRQWVGLTDEEIQTEWLLTPQHNKAEGVWFGRRLEAKLRSKNI
jgi:hypothetical protein